MIRKKSIILFGLSYLSAWLTVVVFFIQNHISYDRVFISFVDAVLKSLIFTYVISAIDERNNGQYYTGASFLLLATVLYNQNSVTKYAVSSLYTGSVDNTFLRFVASQIINLTILVTTFLWRKVHKKNIRTGKVGKRFKKEILVPSVLLWILIILYVILQVVSIYMYGTVARNISSRTMRTVLNALTYVLYSLLVINVKKGVRGKLNIKSLMPIMVMFMLNLYITLETGGKQFIVIFALIICCGLVYLNKVPFDSIKWWLATSPLILQLITSISELMSGRMALYQSDIVLHYHVFRYDLADFAYTIASRYGRINAPLRVIGEAIEMAIPKVFLPSKIDELEAYPAQIGEVGLDSLFDYNDTFFSMGAQAAGFVGIFLVFFLVVLFYEWLSIKIQNIKHVGAPLFLLCISYFAYPESDWSMFVSNTRDLLVYIIIGIIIFKLSVRFRAKVLEKA